MRWRPGGPAPARTPVAIHLAQEEAEALRYLETTGSLARIYGTTAKGFADEYKIDRRLRELELIDSYNKITAKARLSLHLFDLPKVPVIVPNMYSSEASAEYEPYEHEAPINDQCIRVEVNGERLSIRVTNNARTWFAETTVPGARGRRRKQIDRYGDSKADVIHTVIHEASRYMAQAHVKLHS